MLLASRFSLLATVLFILFANMLSAQSVVGYYIRPIEEPAKAFNSTAYKALAENLKANTGAAPVLDQPFRKAIRSSLQKTYYLSFGLPSISTSMKSQLEQSGLFDLIVETTDEMLVGGTPVDDSKNNYSAVTDPPECNSPIETNDPETFVDDFFRNMQIPCAWSITQGSPNVTVAVVDWYFDINNVEVSNKILNDPNHPPFVDNDGEYTRRLDSQGNSATINSSTVGRHGTAMLGGVAAELNNGLCVAGTGGETTLRAYSGLEDGGILGAMQRACDDGNPVISLSAWQSSFNNNDPGTRELVRSVFSDIVDRGTTVLFSVLGANAQHLTDIPGVILVGFGWEDGAYREYDTTNGDGEFDMVVPASGSHRLSGPASCRSGLSGSSLGTAFLSGIVALMLDQNQCLTPVEIERILYETSDDVSNRQCCYPNRFELGKGRVNAYRAVEMAGTDLTPPKLIVNNGETKTIEDESVSYRRIEVRPGGRLNIFNSQVFIEGNRFGQYNDGRIVVSRGAKLVSRNSTLTSSRSKNCEFEGWAGIRVHGNIDREQPDMFNANGELEVNTPIAIDDAGVAMLLDNTIIQHAGNAIATTVPGLPYQDQVDRWGGLVIADRAVFRNNFRAAEFLRYPRRFAGHTFKNKSVFNECLFITTDLEDTRSLGITAWDTDGIRVTRSTFKNIGRESIATIDGSFVVEDGNTFINERNDRNHRHIMSMATYPYSGVMAVGSEDESLARNEFYSGNSVDIFVSGINTAGKGGLKVLNNDFYGRRGGNNLNYAVEIDGAATYQLIGNFIEGSNSFELRNTGLDLFSRGNLVSCNSINNSRYGMRFRGNNAGLKFTGNVFSGDDISGSSIFVDGTIDLFQGNASQPANNRFTTVEQASHIDISVSTSSTPFNYYYSDTGDPIDSEFEPRGESNYNKFEISFKPISDCFSGKPPSGSIKEEDVLAAQNQYQNIKDSANPNLLEEMQEVENAKVIRDDLLNDFVDLAIVEQDLSKINSLLSKIPGPEAKMRHFGACLELGDHNGAKSLLSTIGGMGVGYNDFVSVQEINLDRLEISGQEYVLTESDSTTLDNIAGSESVARGYARAVLYLLKGKRYYDSYEEKTGISFHEEDTSTVLTDLSPSLTVYPNPVTNGKLKVAGEIVRGNGKVIVRRIDGSIISVLSFSNSEELTIEAPVGTGVYFVQVTKGEETAVVKLIVK